MYTNKQFVEYLKKQLDKKTVYMWGDFMRPVTNSTIDQKVKQYPSYYSKDRINYLKSLVGKGYYGSDCSGLIKSFFMSDGGTKSVTYNSKYDNTNNTGTHDIKTLPEVAGIYVYMTGHVGVYIGNGEVIECTSNVSLSKKTYGGVCKTKLNQRKWTKWGYSKYLNYEVEEMKFKVGDKVIINGELYKGSNDTKPSGKVTNKTTNITRVAKGAKHPYNTTNDLGWMDEADIKLYQEPTKDYKALYEAEVKKNKDLTNKLEEIKKIVN